jgi:hypothetical protein
MPGATEKTGVVVDPIMLPEKGSDFLDICLLAGAGGLLFPDIYDQRVGTPLLQSPRHNGA